MRYLVPFTAHFYRVVVEQYPLVTLYRQVPESNFDCPKQHVCADFKGSWFCKERIGNRYWFSLNNVPKNELQVELDERPCSDAVSNRRKECVPLFLDDVRSPIALSLRSRW
jgi:hypothetical protein